MTPIETIAKVLRADRRLLARTAGRMEEIVGHNDVFDRIGSQNEEAIERRLLALGVSRSAPAREVYDALISKIEADDRKVSVTLNRPVCDSQTGCQSILQTARAALGSPRGFFLKEEKAKELLARQPPKNILRYLGYDSATAMLAQENLFEVFSALRFLEPAEWLNGVFFKQYARLTPDDFEERDVRVIALSDKWVEATRKFVAKKYHNISHLKELGLVFVIPINLGISGELLRMLSLIFHYLHEIPFYSDLFKKAAERPETFYETVTSLLRGDVLEHRLPESEKAQWLVIQRYLAKDDEYDWRLFFPHINPEALHWTRAANDIVKLGTVVPDFEKDLSFWRDLDWVGDYFRDEAGFDVLVSFNFVDTAMSLVKEKELVKYLYHHQEALWNKIFTEYYDVATLEKMAKEHIINGWFEI